MSWPEIIAKSGVKEKEIREIAEVYAKSKATIFAWTMGITHHVHGVQNVEAIVNLALLRGMVGREGAGMMPIRGHSNVQGIGSVGVTPKLKDEIFNRLQDNFGVKLPTTAGMDTMACMEAAQAGQLKAGFCLGGNLFGSNPDATYAREALGKLQMIVTLSTTLNTGTLTLWPMRPSFSPYSRAMKNPNNNPRVDVQLRSAERRRRPRDCQARAAKFK